MTTYLTGGLLYLGMLLTLVSPEGASVILARASGWRDFFSLLSIAAVAIMSVPIGYLINQVWMACYNVFLDVHSEILPVDSKLVKQNVDRLHNNKRWMKRFRRAILNEILLALIHRSDASIYSERFLSWHRNRLNTIHSNGTALLSILMGLISCVILSSNAHMVDWIVHPAWSYVHERWWVLASVVCITTASSLRIARERKLILLYNQIALTHEVAISAEGDVHLTRRHQSANTDNEKECRGQ